MEPEREFISQASEPIQSTETFSPLQKESPEWKRFFRFHPHLKQTLRIVAISATTSIAILAIGVLFVWRYRDDIRLFLSPSTEPLGSLSDSRAFSSDVQNPTIGQEQAATELTVTEVVARVNPSVVSIEVSQSGRITSRVVGRGTGFFVSSDGLIVTNRHVVDVASATYSVATSSGKKYTATLVAKDPVFDLAVLKISGSGFPVAVLGDSDSLALGQSVVAIGFALGKFENSISVGVISGLSRSIVASGGGTTEQLDRVIQTDAAINPGNSGGPLINMRGEVIGVNVAVAQGGQSIGFAIPSKSVAEVIASVKQYGFIVRPYVGVSYTPIERQVTVGTTSIDHGIFVSEIILDSPAATAGIRAGDVILSVDGTKLDGDPSFSTIIRNKKVGQTISLRVLRDNVQITVRVTLAQAPVY